MNLTKARAVENCARHCIRLGLAPGQAAVIDRDCDRLQQHMYSPVCHHPLSIFLLKHIIPLPGLSLSCPLQSFQDA